MANKFRAIIFFIVLGFSFISYTSAQAKIMYDQNFDLISKLNHLLDGKKYYDNYRIDEEHAITDGKYIINLNQTCKADNLDIVLLGVLSEGVFSNSGYVEFDFKTDPVSIFFLSLYPDLSKNNKNGPVCESLISASAEEISISPFSNCIRKDNNDADISKKISPNTEHRLKIEKLQSRINLYLDNRLVKSEKLTSSGTRDDGICAVLRFMAADNFSIDNVVVKEYSFLSELSRKKKNIFLNIDNHNNHSIGKGKNLPVSGFVWTDNDLNYASIASLEFPEGKYKNKTIICTGWNRCKLDKSTFDDVRFLKYSIEAVRKDKNTVQKVMNGGSITGYPANCFIFSGTVFIDHTSSYGKNQAIHNGSYFLVPESDIPADINFQINEKRSFNVRSFFTNCSMQMCTFNRTEFQAVSFHSSDLSGSTFQYCKFENSDFSKATMENTVFRNCVFRNMKLKDDYERLKKAKYIDCTFYNVEFPKKLYNYEFSNCSLENCTADHYYKNFFLNNKSLNLSDMTWLNEPQKPEEKKVVSGKYGKLNSFTWKQDGNFIFSTKEFKNKYIMLYIPDPLNFGVTHKKMHAFLNMYESIRKKYPDRKLDVYIINSKWKLCNNNQTKYLDSYLLKKEQLEGITIIDDSHGIILNKLGIDIIPHIIICDNNTEIRYMDVFQGSEKAADIMAIFDE